MWQKNITKKFAVVMLLLFCTHSYAAINDYGVQIPWSYKGNTGPAFWGKLSPHYSLCTTGKQQSPIDIVKNDRTEPNSLSVQYHVAPSLMGDDETTRLTIRNDLTIYNDGHTLQVSFPKDKLANYVTYKGERYELVQFHFHSPSESQLNGEAAPLEVHLVHQGPHGKALVIGVLIKGGAANPLLEELITHLPELTKDKNHLVKDMVNPTELLPLDNDYYSFAGSLTTPPCSENVHWIVMAALITASPAQIASIRAVMGGSNARSVQPLNNRVVSYSMEKSI